MRAWIYGVAATMLLARIGSAEALVFQVVTTVDKPDAVIDGVCADVEGACTLRAAVQEANANPGEDIINIVGAVDRKFPLKVVGAGEDAAASGDLDITGDLRINGNQHAIIQGKKDRVFQIFPGVTVTLDGVIVSKGAVASKVAGVDPATLEGGGILNAGTLIITYGVITGNKAQSDGGGISNRGTLIVSSTTFSKNKTRAEGGGLYNGGQVGGDAELSFVTFSKNSAIGGGGGIDNQHTLQLTNVTLSANKAASGGGLSNHGGGTATLQNVTIKDNKGKKATPGGGVANAAPSVATLTNTLLDKNAPLNCAGAIVSGGGNVENAASCGLGAGDLPNAGKKLLVDKLKFNPSIVQTHGLKPGSPAIDAGVDAGCPEFDENFHSRVDVPGVGTGICDCGAVEFQLP